MATLPGAVVLFFAFFVFACQEYVRYRKALGHQLGVVRGTLTGVSHIDCSSDKRNLSEKKR